jgi:DNA polymerase-3 subunit alpha
MDQLKSIKKHCDRHLLDYTIEEGHLILKDEVFMIVDKNTTIFDEEFQIHKDVYSKVDQYANGIVYEFGGIWYIQKVGEDVSMTELKNIGKAKQKLPTKSFLGIHSGNELLNGIGSYKDWIKKAKFLGVNTLGICEKNSLSGVMGFQNDCKDSNIKSIIGMTLSVVNEKESYEVKLYTKNFQGWLNLLKFSEIINVNGDTAVKEDFLKDNLEGIFVITDPKTTPFESRFKQADFYMVDTVEFDIAETDKKYIDNLELYLKSDLKPIAIFDAYCLEKSDWEAREILWGIGKKFSDKTKNQYFKNNDIYASELIGLFEQGNTSWIKLYKESNKNLDELVSQCNFMYDTVNRRLPKYKMNEWEKDNFKTNEDLFMHYIKLGFAQKKIVDKNKYVERLKEEISVLKKGDVIDYFLVQRDIIAEAKKEGMLTGIGRGSAGGSLVSYLLGIIQIDPIEFDLLFERFLNVGRMGELRDCPAFEIKTDLETIILTEGSLIKIVRNQKESIIFVEELLEGDKIINYN